jgi:hypothetical protein
MSRQLQISIFTRTFVVGIVLLFLSRSGSAQSVIAPPLIADPADKRFVGVDEDWTTPALSKSHLRPVQPLVGEVAQFDTYAAELVQVQWRWGDPIDLWIMKPKGVKKPPVIMYLYGYPFDTDVFKDPDFQTTSTKDGFAAIGFATALTGHRYHDRPMKKWFVSELQESLAVSAHDVQMVLDYLASRGDLDMDRVGVFAQRSGGSIGILASAADPRIKVLDVLDPWADWPAWMAQSPFVPENERADYVKPDYLNKVAALEPTDWIAKVQAKKFRLQQRSFVIETPVVAKDKLAAAAAPGVTVVRYTTRTEFYTVVGNDGSMTLDWVHDQLRSLPQSAPDSATAVQKVNAPNQKP